MCELLVCKLAVHLSLPIEIPPITVTGRTNNIGLVGMLPPPGRGVGRQGEEWPALLPGLQPGRHPAGRGRHGGALRLRRRDQKGGGESQGFQGYGLSILRIRYLVPRMVVCAVLGCFAILRTEGCFKRYPLKIPFLESPRELGNRGPNPGAPEREVLCRAPPMLDYHVYI